MERIVVFAGIVLALIVALGGREAAAYGRTPAPENVKLATIDVYLIIEKIMDKPELKKPREDLTNTWTQKGDAMQRELQQLEDKLKIMPKNAPDAQATIQQAEAKQADYQKLAQDRQTELEKLNSTQLIASYKQVRDAAAAVAGRMGYTHVMSNRSFDRPLLTQTLASTLQELLARPLVTGNAADDITNQVMTELKLTP
jgi:Skp family chaperone for outer membrane proteins